ncbi:MAG: glycosyltransferase [Planctomycetaceae bacterium]|nr:MAG: glycosyltransferase [Planctomycetaceae bacterium]
MKVWMLPELKHFRSEESGIKRVVEAYHKHMPALGIEFVGEGEPYDLKVSHAGTNTEGIAVCHAHGLYWTADLPCNTWEYKANANVIAAMRQARVITVPSEWVAESIRRDMRRNPVVIGHGIDWQEWQHNRPNGGYVLWNKNRSGQDVCDPTSMGELAGAFTNVHFVTTFAPKRQRPNIEEIGVIPHAEMKKLVQGAAVYLSTTKETFGIGVLEAMAAGVPVLGFAHGGNLELVEHGVNGYLAENEEDLQAGLSYCLQHRAVLGDNGREMARRYTWEAACEKVAGVYRLAAEPEQATAAIVIPSFNYAEKVGRAIEGAVSQSYDLLQEIVVVDDGSADDTEAAVKEWADKDSRVRYIRQENQGVAVARNTGVAATKTKYACCLDADDTLEPGFIETCVRALESDPELGIAYTGLRYILPDGKTGVSPWPKEWDFDKQLKRQNQVPTCCVYRKEMWECLGGYKKRYCPKGAGSEDAEFWTRAGAYGWKGEKVTEQPLFIYSWQSGRVSGNKEYSEPDWLAWHPWAFDKEHPFASHATPEKHSHPVRQYDEPAVSVIIPVGPGHEGRLEDALDSLEAQTFRGWEAIVVWDRADGVPERYGKSYPYVRWLATKGRGAGYARNRGVDAARAPFLLFLDADDILDPGCIKAMMAEWAIENAVIYTDYVGLAFISDLNELGRDLRERILWREPDGLTAMRYQALDYDPDRAQAQPTGDPGKVYTWNLITSLVPKAWHEDIGGFDESMPSWEDVDYFWRLAKDGRCFRRIPEPLVIYHFYTGERREFGKEKHRELWQYLIDKHERMEVKMSKCGSCGGSRRSPAPPVAAAARTAPAPSMKDDSFKMCTYAHPNRGQHPVIGQAGFRDRLDGFHMIQKRDRLWYIHYGFRGGGERFLVHADDVKIASHLFREEVTVPIREREMAPPPMPIVAEEKPPEVKVTPPPKHIIDPSDGIQPAERLVAQQVLEQYAAETQGEKLARLEKIESQNPDDYYSAVTFDAQKLPGVTPKIAQSMKQRGIDSLEDVLDLGEEGLQAVEGIGAVRARMIYGRAMEMAAHAA